MGGLLHITVACIVLKKINCDKNEVWLHHLKAQAVLAESRKTTVTQHAKPRLFQHVMPKEKTPGCVGM